MGYYIEHNGEFWQSVFPIEEADKSQLHTDVDDAFAYMVYECGVEPTSIEILPVNHLIGPNA